LQDAVDEATELFERLVALPASRFPMAAVADVLFTASRWSPAAVALQWALQQHDEPVLFDRLMIALTNAGDRQRKRDVLETLLASGSMRAQVLFQLAFMNQEEQRWAEALDLLDTVVALEPAFLAAHRHRGYVLERLGRWEQAADAHLRAIEIAPEQPDIRYRAAFCLEQVAHWQEASLHYRRFCEAMPDDADACFHLGICLEQLGELDAASEQHRRATRLAPEHARAWFRDGSCLSLLERWADAEHSFARAAALTPDDAETWCRHGRCLEQIAAWAGAETSYRRATQLSPDYAEAWAGLGNALGALHRWPEAAASHAVSARLQPSRLQCWVSLMAACVEAGDAAGAANAVRRAIALAPDRLDLKLQGVALLHAADASREAQSLCRELMAADLRDVPWPLFMDVVKAFARVSPRALPAHEPKTWDYFLYTPE
jgi:tetratricopeptide (TPR) repeat protein